jgi:hypothetical protein
LASTINASSSSGIVTTADTSAILQLQTAGTTALTVDTSANVGIGTASPSGKLHVAGSSGQLRISGSGYVVNPAELTLGQYDTTVGYIQAPGGSTGRVEVWNGGTSSIAIFNQYGMGLGTVPTSGTGITFPATQSASSNANTLDDYEEGTWTPALGGTWTSNPTGLGGHYTKIGRFVTAYLEFVGGTKASSISGYFTGLPFNTAIYGTGSATDSNVTNNGLALAGNTNRIWLTGTSFGSTNYVVVNYMTNT